MGGHLGSWAFLIGVILAIIFSFVDPATASTWLPYLLVVLGIIIGLLNVSEKEVQPFMMASVVLVIVSAFGAGVMATIGFLGNFLNNMLFLFVPATIVVALKSVFALAKK
jgi:hypothetical protein